MALPEEIDDKAIALHNPDNQRGLDSSRRPEGNEPLTASSGSTPRKVKRSRQYKINEEKRPYSSVY